MYYGYNIRHKIMPEPREPKLTKRQRGQLERASAPPNSKKEIRTAKGLLTRRTFLLGSLALAGTTTLVLVAGPPVKNT